ncbi:ComEA family DNA-binding protein [Paenibacillus typhae]|uniref:ComEA family DNA-binding protein n=1 Tax=Paenibacillus typhae TaxID=1174501 RepID=UPI001C8E811D|nr:helix-hairpin-helix domain-containing protein [Paenibacillus typhae]MBY0012824.1 helix-hairpin-helix domain-containing protein [Paenibacillus typhae]
MNKRMLGCVIAAALLGGGLVWAADHRTAAGIEGWETLNSGMAQALGVEEGADAASAVKAGGSADPVGSGGNAGTAAAVVSNGAVNSGKAEAAGSDSPGAEVHSAAVNGSDAEADGRINVNTADASALTDLPGIGEKKAQAIIDYRSSKGAFRSLADLGKVKGIGPKMLEKLEGLVIFN